MNWIGLGVEFICIVEWDVIEGVDDGFERDGCYIICFGVDDFDWCFFF